MGWFAGPTGEADAAANATDTGGAFDMSNVRDSLAAALADNPVMLASAASFTAGAAAGAAGAGAALLWGRGSQTSSATINSTSINNYYRTADALKLAEQQVTQLEANHRANDKTATDSKTALAKAVAQLKELNSPTPRDGAAAAAASDGTAQDASAPATQKDKAGEENEAVNAAHREQELVSQKVALTEEIEKNLKPNKTVAEAALAESDEALEQQKQMVAMLKLQKATALEMLRKLSKDTLPQGIKDALAVDSSKDRFAVLARRNLATAIALPEDKAPDVDMDADASASASASAGVAESDAASEAESTASSSDSDEAPAAGPVNDPAAVAAVEKAERAAVASQSDTLPAAHRARSAAASAAAAAAAVVAGAASGARDGARKAKESKRDKKKKRP